MSILFPHVKSFATPKTRRLMSFGCQTNVYGSDRMTCRA
jgi:hypothetical protein